jgi:3-deoxy-D-manno-octulosonic-acid transferase
MSEPTSRVDSVDPAALPALRPPSRRLAQLAYLGYDALGALGAVAAVPALPWLLMRGYGGGAGERLGRLPAAARHLTERPLWLHCASVGETRSAAPLVSRLRERAPRRPLVVSTTTLSGRAVARDDLGADVATLLPVDALHIVDRVFRTVRPRALVLVETELWPGLLRAAAAVGAPVAMVSGRLSARALARYRWAGPLFPAALAHVSAFAMQTGADAERIIALGAAPERVRVTGSLKASTAPAAAAPPPLDGLAQRRVLVAASTQPGEEEFVLRAFAALQPLYRDTLLILAPRRPERFDAVAGLAATSGLPWQRRSALAGAVGSDVAVLVLDTLGELVRFFPAAWAVFVGGTVAPLGGHNVLEPAAHGRPVAFGPHTANVAAAAAALCAAGGGAVVHTPAELAEHWVGLLALRAAADAAGARARAALTASADALERTWEMVMPLLEECA